MLQCARRVVFPPNILHHDGWRPLLRVPSCDRSLQQTVHKNNLKRILSGCSRIEYAKTKSTPCPYMYPLISYAGMPYTHMVWHRCLIERQNRAGSRSERAVRTNANPSLLGVLGHTRVCGTGIKAFLKKASLDSSGLSKHFRAFSTKLVPQVSRIPTKQCYKLQRVPYPPCGSYRRETGQLFRWPSENF